MRKIRQDVVETSFPCEVIKVFLVGWKETTLSWIQVASLDTTRSIGALVASMFFRPPPTNDHPAWYQ